MSNNEILRRYKIFKMCTDIYYKKTDKIYKRLNTPYSPNKLLCTSNDLEQVKEWVFKNCKSNDNIAIFEMLYHTWDDLSEDNFFYYRVIYTTYL